MVRSLLWPRYRASQETSFSGMSSAFGVFALTIIFKAYSFGCSQLLILLLEFLTLCPYSNSKTVGRLVGMLRCLCPKQCCGSGMFIPDPDFYPSRISDPGSKNSNKREWWEKLKCWRKKLGQFSNYRFFTQNIVTKLSNYGFGIRDPEKTYSGSRGQKGTGSRIPDPQHCKKQWFRLVDCGACVLSPATF